MGLYLSYQIQKAILLDFIREKANGEKTEAIAFWKKLNEFDYKEGDDNFFEEYKDTYEKKDIQAFSKIIKKITEALIKEVEQGNKHRKVYLEEIKADIQNSSELNTLLDSAKKKISQEEFFHILGHISNIQLRLLRKYFNDKTMRNGNDYWDKKRLKKFYIRYLKAWHTKRDSEEKTNQLELLKQLEQEEKSILELFLNNHPSTSIPPCEDQNNRHIPTCQSLLLNAKKLDKQFPGWREIVKKLGKQKDETENYKILDFYDPENLDKVYRELQRSLQGAKKDLSLVPFDKDSILFQRILETSIALDLYKLRWHVEYKQNANGQTPEKFFGNTKKLKLYQSSEENFRAAEINAEEKEILLNIAERIYQDTEDARKGLWEEETSLLSKCNSKTKHKNKTQEVNVKQILRISDSQNFSLEDFKAKVWNKKISRNSTIKSLCENIEKERKQYGNLFSAEYEKTKWKLISQARNANDKLPVKKDSKPTEEEKKLQKIFENVQLISKTIAEYLGHNEEQIRVYQNPFSLAQIYNILETEQKGFSKICHACQLENAWRSQREETTPLQGETADKGVRLSGDTGRPFDGQIDRIVTRIAKEIAKQKFIQLKENLDPKKIQSLEIPVFLENNKFSFTEEALNLKKSSKKAKDKFEKQKKKFEDRLKTKEERIKSDSQNICAYAGKQVGKDGEIDHIIPRSSTIESFGSVYNSELNLLYVSREGNQKKGNQLYSLENIHDKFLKTHFETNDRNVVRSKVQEILQKIKEDNRKEKRNYIIADKLEPNERIAIKMALFDKKLREEVMPFLSMHSKALVNGTQAWFFKRLRQELSQKIKKEFPNLQELKITSHFLSTSDDDFALKSLREKLSETNPAYKKEEKQKESSHIIDATMVFAQGLIQSTIPGKYNLRSPLIPDEAQVTGEWLESLLPEELELRYIERKSKYRKENPESSPLFKASMYAERFLSLLIDSKGIRFGFTPEKASGYLDGKVEKEIFKALKPFLLFQHKFISEDLEHYKQLQTSSGFVLLKLHRNKVKEYLQNCSNEDKLGILLESLRYITQNKNVLDDKGKLKMPESKPQSFKVLWSNKNLLSFSLLMPYLDEWKKLEAHLRNVPEEKYPEEIRNFFHSDSSIKNPSKHGTKARKMSLPTKAEPSGGFRILRTNERKEKIYQVQAGDGPNAGFQLLDHGDVDFKTSVLSPAFLSKNVKAYQLAERQIAERFVYFDEWRSLPVSEDLQKVDIKEIFMKPDTKARCYLRVGLDSKKLFALLGNSKNSSNLLSLKYSINFSGKKNGEFKKLGEFLKENISDQRDYIYITKITKEVVFVEFVASGFPTSLQTLYNQGTKVENP